MLLCPSHLFCFVSEYIWRLNSSHRPSNYNISNCYGAIRLLQLQHLQLLWSYSSLATTTSPIAMELFISCNYVSNCYGAIQLLQLQHLQLLYSCSTPATPTSPIAMELFSSCNSNVSNCYRAVKLLQLQHLQLL